jgi:hypothetical protein
MGSKTLRSGSDFDGVRLQSVNAFTGPPNQERQDLQWQYPIPSGTPVASNLTAPQKHSSRYTSVMIILPIRAIGSRGCSNKKGYLPSLVQPKPAEPEPISLV